MAHPIVSPLLEEVTKATGVMASATAFIEGVPTLVAAAREEAVALGASAEQLEPFVALEADLEAKHDALVAALAANAPPAETALFRRR